MQRFEHVVIMYIKDDKDSVDRFKEYEGDGWEVCGVTGDLSGQSAIMFKRPINQTT